MLTYATIHAVAVNTEGKYLILERSANRPRAGTWNVVTGYIKEKEPAEYATLRILKSETNLDGKIIRTADPFWIDRANVRWLIVPYLLEVEDISGIKIDPEESENHKWVNADDFLVQSSDALRQSFIRLGLIALGSNY